MSRSASPSEVLGRRVPLRGHADKAVRAPMKEARIRPDPTFEMLLPNEAMPSTGRFNVSGSSFSVLENYETKPTPGKGSRGERGKGRASCDFYQTNPSLGAPVKTRKGEGVLGRRGGQVRQAIFTKRSQPVLCALLVFVVHQKLRNEAIVAARSKFCSLRKYETKPFCPHPCLICV